MRRVFIKKVVTAGAFVAILSTGAILSVRKNFTMLKENVVADVQAKEPVSGIISKVESTINENAYGKYTFIEAYGYVQRVFDKKEENDFEVVKDQEGSLHLSYFAAGPKETKAFAADVAEFQKSLVNKDTLVMYVMTPDKYLNGVTVMEPGLPYNYANETADSLLKDLKAQGIASMDYREGILQNGIPTNELFYKTDHHWTTNTAFWAFKELAGKLGIESEHTDIENYNVVTYPNSFLGSLGRKTGSLYSGVDDFSLILPKFETDYAITAESYDNKITAEGRFEESLLDLGALQTTGSPYDAQNDRYSTYLYGNQGLVHITNKKQADGPKVLLVKDSYMVPVAAFLSTVCSDVYLVDPRYYEGSISEYANSIEGLDYALISFYPQDITEEFFRLNNKVNN